MGGDQAVAVVVAIAPRPCLPVRGGGERVGAGVKNGTE